MEAMLIQQKCEKALKGEGWWNRRPSWSNLRSSTKSVMTWRILRSNLRMKIKLYSCCVLYRNLLNRSKIPCSMAKKALVTLEKVQAALRTRKLTKSKDLRIYENGEGLNVSRGNGGGRGNRRKSGNKSKSECFNCHKMGDFLKDCLEINGNSAQIVSKGYEDAGALMVWCFLLDEEGDASHLGIDA
ncbi:hypothetical protein MTR_4g035750 [Medicago truncatula]|uniref:Uncharacterized protein n=1 Tax=Medicago truncatula TaxID=3880 RepID=A0A072UU29_MEDTR|nr:hypothetical protein MTR_4g035750 [Medicago truncatula]